MEQETYKSNVYGRLKVKGKILKRGDIIKLTPDEIKNNKDIRELVVTEQLVRDYD